MPAGAALDRQQLEERREKFQEKADEVHRRRLPKTRPTKNAMPTAASGWSRIFVSRTAIWSRPAVTASSARALASEVRWPIAMPCCRLAVLTAVSLLAAPAQQPTFRAGVQTVAVYATVRDASGRLAPDLTRDDFEILDNGKPVQITSFSNDPQQRTLYVADGSNQKVWVVQRDTLKVTSSFGAGGRWPGHFYGVGSIAVDSRGTVYTGETYEGKRVQKFVYKGMAPVTRMDRGVPWPSSR